MLAHTAGTRAADSKSSTVGRARQRVHRVLRVRHQPDDVARGVAHARNVPRGAVEVLPGGVAQHDLPVRLELVQHRIGRPVATGHVFAGTESRSPTVHAPVHDVDALTTSNATWRQVNFNEVFGSRAPASSPASQSTWNPLQIPSTSPPRRAKRSTSTMIGDTRAIAPARR